MQRRDATHLVQRFEKAYAAYLDNGIRHEPTEAKPSAAELSRYEQTIVNYHTARRRLLDELTTDTAQEGR